MSESRDTEEQPQGAHTRSSSMGSIGGGPLLHLAASVWHRKHWTCPHNATTHWLPMQSLSSCISLRQDHTTEMVRPRQQSA